MSRGGSPFTYRALTPETSRIRLIQFQQNLTIAEDSPIPDHEVSSLSIHCDIRHVTLEQAPPYAALSYTWGSNLDSEIILNGTPLTVARNLAYALRSLRDRNEVDYIWVDALCIDQSNEVEKTEQVRQMQHIYARAAHVVAWVGPAEDDSDCAMRWIQHHGKVAHELGIGSKPELRFRALLQESHENSNPSGLELARAFAKDVFRQFTSTGDEQRATFLALSKLLDRAFWNRMWIVQEMTHGQVLSFRCGDLAVEEEHFHHASRLLRNALFSQKLNNIEHSAGNCGVEVMSIKTINPVTLLKLRRAKQTFPLIYLVRHLRLFNASDPRDKVFAVLNCASDTRLQPDYRMSCESVFLETTFSLLEGGFFDILTLCGPRNNTRKLPSWVPDFTIKYKVNALQQRALTRQIRPMTTVLQPEFDASNGVKCAHTALDYRDDGTPMLMLQAVLVGKVVNVGEQWNGQEVGTWLKEFQQLLPRDLANRHQQLESISRTAVADQEIRHGNSKPRLSSSLLQKVIDVLGVIGLSDVTAQDLILAGAGDYVYQMDEVAVSRRPFLTSEGQLGIGPAATKLGDCVYILRGSSTPHILRTISRESLTLVGEAYVHSIMDGEFVRVNSGVQTIAIV